MTNAALELLEENAEPVGTTASEHEFVFAIEGTEYDELRNWDHWVERRALAGTYVYRFGTVSMGKGFSSRVTDTET